MWISFTKCDFNNVAMAWKFHAEFNLHYSYISGRTVKFSKICKFDGNLLTLPWQQAWNWAFKKLKSINF